MEEEVVVIKRRGPEGTNRAQPSILQSVYFQQPRVIDAYLQSCLKSPDFPQSQLNSLKALLLKKKTEAKQGSDEHDDRKGEGKEITTITDEYEEIISSLHAKQKAELVEAIKALSSSLLTISRTTSNNSSSSSSGADNKIHNTKEAEQRCLLGYCKLLNRQWTDSIVDFDIVRRDLYNNVIRVRKGKAAMVPTPPGDASTADMDEEAALRRIYAETLDGLQIASSLLGKDMEVARYAKWKAQAVAG